MYKIVKTLPTEHQPVTIKQALESIKKNGMIVAVYDRRVSVLVDGAHNSYLGRCAGLYTLASNYYGRWSTQSATDEEVLERTLPDTGSLYYFPTLAEFAAAVIKEGWI